MQGRINLIAKEKGKKENKEKEREKVKKRKKGMDSRRE